MNPMKPAAKYDCFQSSYGCDDLMEIYDTETEEVILGIPYWTSDTAWAARVETLAKSLIANPDLLLRLRDQADLNIEENGCRLIDPTFKY